MSRREFPAAGGKLAGGVAVAQAIPSVIKAEVPPEKMRLAVVGTGVRAVGMYGKELLAEYSNYLEIAGLCDINPGRLQYAKQYMGVTCPTFTDLGEMLRQTEPNKLFGDHGRCHAPRADHPCPRFWSRRDYREADDHR